MIRELQSQQRGAVSLITVIFVSIILIILTTSFIRLSVNEQRRSTDDDLTTRAYYAAESGVQDAVAAIKTGTIDPAKAAICDHNSSGTIPDGNVLSDPNGLNSEYTCQKIDMTPREYEASLSEGESTMFHVDSSSDNIDGITISWHVMRDDAVGRTSADTALPKTDIDAWKDSGSGKQYPAMMRVQIIAIPNAGVNRGNINNKIAYLNPVEGGAGSGGLGALDGFLNGSVCDNSTSYGNYTCSYEITGLNELNNEYYLRLQPLYRGTEVRVVAKSGGSPVPLVDVQAVIDVTGRAGDVYRRVEERVDLNSEALGLDFAIISAEDLCKNFVITDQADHPTEPDFADVNTGIVGSCKP